LATMTRIDQDTFYATGKRKSAIARVYMKPGQGNIIINNKPMADYLERKTLELIVKEPLNVTNSLGKFDFICRVSGGGKAGQAGAVRHGIARALVVFNPDSKPVLKKAGLITRDSRVKERKKYGRKRARRGFQWTKR